MVHTPSSDTSSVWKRQKQLRGLPGSFTWGMLVQDKHHWGVLVQDTKRFKVPATVTAAVCQLKGAAPCHRLRFLC